jgi:nickel-type superoxide dismutase maturation protease
MIVSQPLFRAMREGLAWLSRRRMRVRVTGASMLPTLSDGEFVLVDPAAAPRIGQLVVAVHPQQDDLLVIKRLIGRDEGGLVVASDNPEAGSDSRSWGPVPPDRLMGVVTLVLDRPTTGPDLRGEPRST